MASLKLHSKERPSFAKLTKGYLGFLAGTGKSLSTISSYKGDLALFERFLSEQERDFYALNKKDLSAYSYWLERQGLKINTRRRKILSAKALVKYAVSRKKVPASDLRFLPAPERLERLPWIPKEEDYARILAVLDPATGLGLRNLLVVRLLAETGLTVAELCGLRWSEWQGNELQVEGKKPRSLALSPATAELLRSWREKNQGKHLFPGFNRFGVTSEKMTSRGVELFFRRLAKASGFPNLKPKTLRHLTIATWLRENVPEAEIQRRLGVHSHYSFYAYRKHLASAL